MGSRRERHTDKTRAAIADAAVDLFAEKGFAETTIDEIAERADIAPRTFFRYFPTKEAVLFNDSASDVARATELLRARPLDEPVFDSLIAVLREIAAQAGPAKARKHLVAKAAAESSRLFEHHRAVVMCQLEDAIIDVLVERAGPEADRLALTAAVAALLATFGTAMREWIAEGADGDLEPILERCVASARTAFSG
jgi:AcrR family transcriptional regulator